MPSPLRELIARFATEADTKPLEKSDGLLDSLAKKSGVVGDAFKRLRTAIGGAAIAGGVIAFTREFVSEAENLQYTSDRLRTTTQDLQVMGAVGRSVGLDLNATTAVLGTLRGKLDEAVRGLGDGGYTMRRLGVQFRDQNRQARPLVDVFGDVAEGLSRVRSEYRRNILSDRLLGSEGRRLVRLYGDGRDAVRDFTEALRDSGGGTSQEAITAGVRLSRAWNIANLSVDSLQSRLAVFLLPKLEAVVRATGRLIGYLNRTTVVTNGFKIAIGAAAIVAVRAIASINAQSALLVARFALIGAAIAVVVLVVDDLITMFSGGKSVIGGFIDEIFGIGTAAGIVDELKYAFREFMGVVREVMGAVGELWDSLVPESVRSAFSSTPRTSAGTPTRTPIRRRGATPGSGANLTTGGGVGSVAADNAAAALRAALERTPALGTPRAPSAPPGAAARLRGFSAGGVPGLVVPAPSAARAGTTINTDSRITVQVNATTPEPAAVGRASGIATQRALSGATREQVRALENSGLIRNRGPGRDEG